MSPGGNQPPKSHGGLSRVPQPKGAPAVGTRPPVAPPPVHWPRPLPGVSQAKTAPLHPPAPPRLAPPPLPAAAPARRPVPPPPVPRPVQPKLAAHVQPALRAVRVKTPLGAGSPVLQKAEEKSKLIEKRREMTFKLSNVIANGQSSWTRKGWLRTAVASAAAGPLGVQVATYTKATDTLQVFNDLDFQGSGRVNGLFNGAQQSYCEVHSGSGGVAEQTYMDSKPQGNGIGTILSYEGALILQRMGFKKIKTGMINGNSARLADTLSEDTSCCSCGWGCFLVTACAEARGLPEDCEELVALRAFRDGYLMESEATRAMVATYYEIAPRIVTALKASATAREEFESLYLEILLCVELIRKGDFEGALRNYRTTVEELAVRYLPGGSREKDLRAAREKTAPA